MNGRRIILIGFFCVLVGAGLPFAIILGMLPSTFFLNFIAFSTSVMGIFLGAVGISFLNERSQHKNDHWT